ncbi:DinB family protein [Mesobacterium pallidum]|uniref:DinB family protein n=1 Tax=Mesobacterium pallidum TaxID=2872037 RepID=UPI001EE30851|nr:DinB family protein [Mesobacterium pallidum]
MGWTNPHIPWALNNAYANRVLYGALDGMAEAEFCAVRPGAFPSLCATLNHVYEVDLYYLDALTEGGRGRAVYDRGLVRDWQALARLQAEADLQLAMFCQKLTAEDMTRRVATERRDQTVTEEIGAILPHLFQHQVHHRGQAHVQLAHAGVAPPQLDEFFLEYERAEIARQYFG